jgi:hypothetical protein
MEVSTCISKPHAIFIFYLASASTERLSSDRRRRPQLDTQQLVTWPQLAVMVYNLKRMAIVLGITKLVQALKKV